VAAKAKWTVATQANATFTPATAEAPASSFNYTVTRAGPDVRVTASFRATSTAGVAEGTWSQPTETNVLYVVDAVTYTASHSGSVSGDDLPCSSNGSVTESVSAGPLPFDGIAGLTALDGGYVGFISSGIGPLFMTMRAGSIEGCDTSVTTGPPPACTVSIRPSIPVVIFIDVEIAAAATTANVTWSLPGIFIDDGGNGFPCSTTSIGATPAPEVRQEPASTFLSPGTHTLSVTRTGPFTTTFEGVTAVVNGTSTTSITFHRVNSDGSPYTE
jgi:hypothetical protein